MKTGRLEHRILEYLAAQPQGVDVASLATALRASVPRTQHSCRQLQLQGAVRARNTAEGLSLTVVPAADRPWSCSGQLSARVHQYLERAGFRVLGPDTPGAVDLRDAWVRVVALPAGPSGTGRNRQARQWFFNAFFELSAWRGEHPEGVLFVALPDDPLYAWLLSRVRWLLPHILRCHVLRVGRDGQVSIDRTPLAPALNLPPMVRYGAASETEAPHDMLPGEPVAESLPDWPVESLSNPVMEPELADAVPDSELMDSFEGPPPGEPDSPWEVAAGLVDLPDPEPEIPAFPPPSPEESELVDDPAPAQAEAEPFGEDDPELPFPLPAEEYEPDEPAPPAVEPEPEPEPQGQPVEALEAEERPMMVMPLWTMEAEPVRRFEAPVAERQIAWDATPQEVAPPPPAPARQLSLDSPTVVPARAARRLEVPTARPVPLALEKAPEEVVVAPIEVPEPAPEAPVSTGPAYVLRASERKLELWSCERLPFEPHGTLWQMRTELRTALAALKASEGEVLHAVYGSDSQDHCELENVLMYNVGPASFQNSMRHGVRFERTFERPQCDEPLSGPAEHYHCYSPTASSDPFQHWIEDSVLAEWDRAIIADPSKLESVWAGMKKAMVQTFATHQRGDLLGLTVRVKAPPTVRRSLPGFVKPLIDGVMCAFHRHDGPVEPVASKLSARLKMAPVAVAEWLQAPSQAVLGDRLLLTPREEGLQWNPADDVCVAVELLTNPSPGDQWRLSGKLVVVKPRL